MQTFEMATNIKCNGCIAKVTPFLIAEPRIHDWKVDIADSRKPLAVKAEGMRQQELLDLLARAGYQGEPFEIAD